MVLVEIDKAKRLLLISAAGHVSSEELKEAASQVRDALLDAGTGVRALTDFRTLESMEASSAVYIAEIMDALANKQVDSVIKIIRDPDKDVGFNILSQFRYTREPPITTVTTLVEALDSLWNGMPGAKSVAEPSLQRAATGA
jgi:hypothetical protein